MMPLPVTFTPIGVIHSEHRIPQKTPIQPAFAQGCVGQVEVFAAYAGGLRDIEGFSHIILLYYLNRAGAPKLLIKPFLDAAERGIFATRAPRRPNALGLSIVELVRREGNRLFIEGADMLDETPLLDIKPYSARFDRIVNTHNGWQDSLNEEEARRRGRRGFVPR